MLFRPASFCCAFVSLLIVSCPVAILANDDGFRDFLEAEQATFDSFQTAEDKAFVSFLEAEWEAFQVFKGDIRDEIPKPAIAPTIRNAGMSAAPSTEGINVAAGLKFEVLSSGFYGHPFESVLLPVNEFPDLTKPTNKRLAMFWAGVSRKDHRQTVMNLQQHRQRLGLGDWGLFLYVQKQVEQQIAGDKHRIAYTWFLLNRLGFDIRIGYSSESVFLLVPASNKVYGRTYTTIDKKKYYMYPDVSSDSVRSYNQKSSQSVTDFDFSLNRLLKASAHQSSLKAEIQVDSGDVRTLDFKYDLGLSEFLASYPQIELDSYFTVEPGSPAADSLLEQLRPLVAGLEERVAVNVLLRFTQRLFGYQTDDKQFGKEKYLLIEESLHYGVNDCEDRTIFLAWLVKSLLKLDTVALDYPGHIAMAVRTRVLPYDDVVSYQGKQYVVADPTYIGADLGMSQPNMRNKTPIIIAVNYQ